MSGLSTAHRVALAALIEQAPDAMLTKLSSVAVALPGERALELGDMLADEVLDRNRRRPGRGRSRGQANAEGVRGNAVVRAATCPPLPDA